MAYIVSVRLAKGYKGKPCFKTTTPNQKTKQNHTQDLSESVVQFYEMYRLIYQQPPQSRYRAVSPLHPSPSSSITIPTLSFQVCYITEPYGMQPSKIFFKLSYFSKMLLYQSLAPFIAAQYSMHRMLWIYQFNLVSEHHWSYFQKTVTQLLFLNNNGSSFFKTKKTGGKANTHLSYFLQKILISH